MGLEIDKYSFEFDWKWMEYKIDEKGMDKIE